MFVGSCNRGAVPRARRNVRGLCVPRTVPHARTCSNGARRCAVVLCAQASKSSQLLKILLDADAAVFPVRNGPDELALTIAVGRNVATKAITTAALSAPVQASRGSVVEVESEAAFDIGGVTAPSADFTAHLFYVAYTVMSAICSKVSDVPALRGQQVIVLGGPSCSAAVFATIALTQLGAKVCSVSTDSMEAMRQLGAQDTADPRVESFSEKWPEAVLVLDALGREDSVSSALSTSYVSIAPAELLAVLENGLLSRLGGLFGRAPQPKLPVCVVRPAELTAMRTIFQAKTVEKIMQQLPSKTVNRTCLREASSWPRDADTGKRYGFPGSSLWPSTDSDSGSDSDNSVAASESAASLAEHVKEPAQEVVALGAFVQSVASSNDLNMAVRGKNSVLFVSAGWCRKCRYIKRQYARISEELHTSGSDLSFLHLDAEAHPDVASELGVSDVPEFLIYRDGLQIASNIQTTNRELLKKSLLKAVH